MKATNKVYIGFKKIFIVIVLFFITVQPLFAEVILDKVANINNLKKIIKVVKNPAILLNPEEIAVEILLTGVSYVAEKTYKKFFDDNKN